MIYILAIVLAGAGSFGLYKGWKTQRWVYSVIGWLVIAFTFLLWNSVQGVEFGSIFAISLPALLVWLWIALERKYQAVKVIQKPHQALPWHTKSVLSHTALVLYHLIFLMILSSVMCIALIDFLPVLRVTQIAIGIICLPIIWSLLSFWHLMSNKKLLTIILNLMLLGGCAAYLLA